MNGILVIDDHCGYRAYVAELLKAVQPQAQVLQAHDGREGIALALSAQPELILLDVNMPVMDGYEAACALKALPHTQLIPIIAMTLAGNEESVTLAYLRPFCQSILFKPFNEKQLINAIAQISTSQLE